MYLQIFVRAWNRKRKSFSIGYCNDTNLSHEEVLNQLNLTAQEKQYADVRMVSRNIYQSLPKDRPNELEETVTIPKELAKDLLDFLELGIGSELSIVLSERLRESM